MPDGGHLAEQRRELQPGGPSLKDLMHRIEADASLSPAKRTQWCCSLRRISAFLQRTPVHLPARMGALRFGLLGLHHENLGISKKSLQNHLANLKAALSYARGHGSTSSRAQLSREWSNLRDVLVMTRHRRGLSSFLHYASVQGVAPTSVCDATVEAFISWRLETSFVKKPRDLRKQVARIWNEAAQAHRQWPQQLLTVPDYRPKARSLSWDRFHPDFLSDVEHYLDWLAGRSLDDDGPIRPCKPRTLETRRKMIQLAASAAVRAGRPVETLRSLADLVAPPTVKAVLEAYLAKSDSGSTVFIADLAGMLSSIARAWCRCPEPDLEQLTRFRKRLDQQYPKGLTEKNMTVVRQVLDKQTWRRVRDLPSRLMDEALKEKAALNRAAVRAQIAVAIQILIVAPLRISNLVALSLDESLVRPAGPNGPIHLVVPEYDVKNRVPLEYPLPAKVSRMIDLYLSRFRHTLKGSNGPWLFPGRIGDHKAPRTLSQQITEVLWKECGLKMTPHQFRHAAGAIILKYDPGNYELVRRVLGHRSLQTTINAYVGLESLDAARLFSQIALGPMGDQT